MILLIDNYDSFTWNLVQELGRIRPGLSLGPDLLVARNDAITPEHAESLDNSRGPSRILISPGPCGPDQAGVSAAIVHRFAGRVPILGVCLGHQVIAAAFGMTVARAHRPVHGRTSPIFHDSRGVFSRVPSPLTAARYHSLAVQAPAPGWEVSAWTDDATDAEPRRTIMGLRRVWDRAMLEGVQFHPESFMTEGGGAILRNFLEAPSYTPAP